MDAVPLGKLDVVDSTLLPPMIGDPGERDQAGRRQTEEREPGSTHRPTIKRRSTYPSAARAGKGRLQQQVHLEERPAFPVRSLQDNGSAVDS
jgi:hypothetical protein